MNKAFIFCLFIAFLFLGCCDDDTKSARAKMLDLVCINGYVFKKHREINFFHANDITLEPLNITCENGKVEVN